MAELRRMNDDVSEDSSLKDVDSFKKQYAAVLVQLNEVLDQARLSFSFNYTTSMGIQACGRSHMWEGGEKWREIASFLLEKSFLLASF